MKCLTISQPFASLIASGAKWVENRSWPTAYRGPLAIHAGRRSAYLPRAELAAYPTGVVLATCELVGCIELAAIHREGALDGCGRSVAELLAHEHTEGPWCWVLADVVPVAPYPATGRLGLWDSEGPLVPIGIEAAVLGPLGAGTTQGSSPPADDAGREPSGPGTLF